MRERETMILEFIWKTSEKIKKPWVYNWSNIPLRKTKNVYKVLPNLSFLILHGLLDQHLHTSVAYLHLSERTRRPHQVWSQPPLEANSKRK